MEQLWHKLVFSREENIGSTPPPSMPLLRSTWFKLNITTNKKIIRKSHQKVCRLPEKFTFTFILPTILSESPVIELHRSVDLFTLRQSKSVTSWMSFFTKDFIEPVLPRLVLGRPLCYIRQKDAWEYSYCCSLITGGVKPSHYRIHPLPV